MKIDKLILGAVISLIVISSILLFVDRRIEAQDEGAGGLDPAQEKKLDEILSGQKTILQELESIKSELEVIKIRVTQRT